MVMHPRITKHGLQSLKASQLEFCKKCRRISIKNIPCGISTQDILELLKPYFYQQIHIDKNSQSCKAVLLDGSSATRCISELHCKKFHGQNLFVTLASCDFMLCVTQLPLSYTHGQFLNLITPFGTPERCFLVYSEKTGESKGYGCVEFTSKESSIKAKNQLNGHKIENNTLQVHWLDSIPAEYSGLSSRCLLVEDLPIGFTDNSVLLKIFSCNATPKYCQLASCSTGEFAVVEYQDANQCEEAWHATNGHKLGNCALKVSFCVPGPCGLVVLNALKASRDLKSANPSGGLLPTPLHLLDSNQNNGTVHRMLHQKMKDKSSSEEILPASTDLKVQQIINSFHNAIETPAMIEAVKQAQDPSIAWQNIPLAQQQGLMWGDMPRQQTMPNHLMVLRSRSGSISSCDSVKADDEVFEPMRRKSQEEQQHLPKLAVDETARHYQPTFNQRAPHDSSVSQLCNTVMTSSNPVAPSSTLFLREDSQRSDSSDSAYGGSQGSNSDLAYPLSKDPVSNGIHSMHHLTGFLPEHPIHMTSSNFMGTFQHPNIQRYHHPTSEPPGTKSSMFPGTQGGASYQRTISFPRGLTSAFELYSEPPGIRQHRSAPSKPIAVKSRSTDRVHFTPRNKNHATPVGQHLQVDSPTQLQLLGSSLMEGLLGESPRSALADCDMEVEGTGGRFIHALNLFSPIEAMVTSRTPTPGMKHVLPSPEPSPEAGAYVGQHSQGLGGHYADSCRMLGLQQSPLSSLLVHKRRRSNDI